MGNGPKAAHHQGPHARLSAIARAHYNASPDTRCARCGGLARAGDPWQAGHPHDGIPLTRWTDYQPEHASCNQSAGAAVGNRRRKGLETTIDW